MNATDWVNNYYGELDSNTSSTNWTDINSGDFKDTGPILLRINCGTAAESFALDKIRIKIRKQAGATGTVRIEVNDAYAELDISTLKETMTWEDITDIKGDRTIQAGTIYLTIYSPEGAIFWIDYVADALSSTTTYWDTDGKIGQSGDFDSWADGAAIQTELYGGDWDVTLCKYNEYIRKVGVNASTQSKEVEFARDVCKQAECTLNSRTRRDWTNAYSSLSANVKEILNRIVSNIAAIEGINIDMSGFTSRLEAMGMIENLRWGTEKLTQELKNQNTQEFMINL